MITDIQFQTYFDDNIKKGDLILWLDCEKWVVLGFNKKRSKIDYFDLTNKQKSSMYIGLNSNFQQFKVLRT